MKAPKIGFHDLKDNVFLKMLQFESSSYPNSHESKDPHRIVCRKYLPSQTTGPPESPGHVDSSAGAAHISNSFRNGHQSFFELITQ